MLAMNHDTVEFYHRYPVAYYDGEEWGERNVVECCRNPDWPDIDDYRLRVPLFTLQTPSWPIVAAALAYHRSSCRRRRTTW